MKTIFALAILIFIHTAVAGADSSNVFGASSAPDTVRLEVKKRNKKDLKSELDLIGSAEVEGVRQWERQKSARVAVLSSMVLPGLGQVYNGRRIKVAFMVGFMTYYMGTAWVEHKREVARLQARDSFPPGSSEWQEEDLFYQFHKANALDFAWWSGAIWLIGVLDAFVDAHLYDVRSVSPTVMKASTSGKNYVGLSVNF